MDYPHAPRLDFHVEAHGRKLHDPYRWLEDRDDPDRNRWLAVATAEGRAHLDAMPQRAWFEQRLRAQFATGMVGLPETRGAWTFIWYRASDQQHMTLRARPASLMAGPSDGGWRTLVDPNVVDPDLLTTLDATFASPDGELVAYLMSRGGDEESRLWVLATATGAVVEGPYDRCRSLFTHVGWMPDGRSWFWTRRAPAGSPGGEWRVYRHVLGTDPDAADLEVFGADGPSTRALEPLVSVDGRWVVVTDTEPPGTAVDLYLAAIPDDGDAHMSFERLLAEEVAEQHPTWGMDGRLWIRSAFEAPTWKLGVIDIARGDRDLTVVVPDDPKAVLRGFAVIEGAVVANRATDDISALSVWAADGTDLLGDVPVPGRGSVSGPLADPGGSRIFFGYSDHTTPQAAWTWSDGDAASTLWMGRPGDIDVTDIDVDRVDVTSADGTLVPMLVFRTGPLDAPRPALVFGYGGFGYSVLRPSFDHWATAWAAAGGVYAIVGARGGGELGEAWHHAGWRENKPRTFEDFIAAGEWLVARGYTTHDQLGACGLSNGAFTVAASVNRSPSTFAVAVACAMHADNLRSLRNPDAEGWMQEYGDGRDPVEFQWLLQDSPYHQTKPGVCYPATLVCAFGRDTRTAPEEGHKYTALLQWATACDRPIVLRHEENAGHATRSVTQMVDLLADWLGFCAFHLGLHPPVG